MCPRGGIGRHKGLKILAACGVPVRVRPRAPSYKTLYFPTQLYELDKRTQISLEFKGLLFLRFDYYSFLNI